MQWASYIDLTPFKPSEWVISTKVIKDLNDAPFDGDMFKYKDWHDMLRDHLLAANHGYGRILFETEREPNPLTFSRLQQQPKLNGLNADLTRITTNLWTLISRHVTKSFRTTLRSLADGQG